MMMNDIVVYASVAVAVVCFLAAFMLWRKQQSLSAHHAVLFAEKIHEAQMQRATFNIAVNVGDPNGMGFMASLMSVEKKRLIFEVLDIVPRSVSGRKCTVYFHLKEGDGQQLFTFDSKIRSVKGGEGFSSLELGLPAMLQVGQKRHFHRAKPSKEEVNALGLWLLNAQQPVPRTTRDIGHPLRAVKSGMPHPTLALEDISASGMGLRVRVIGQDLAPLTLTRNLQIMAVIAFPLGGENVTFWCTGEIVNVRPQNEVEVICGVEFINWALFKKGEGKFSWHHTIPTRGIPILAQWADALEHKVRRM